jgi:hypothetical protein
MNARDNAAAGLHPVSPEAAEALKTGRPPARGADDGNVGGRVHEGEPGVPNDPGVGGEADAPGDAGGDAAGQVRK